jgi:hypothetical protein
LGTLNGGPMVHSVVYQKTVIMKTGLHYVYGMCVLAVCVIIHDIIFYDRDRNGLQIPIPCHHSHIQSFTVVEVSAKLYIPSILLSSTTLQWKQNQL